MSAVTDVTEGSFNSSAEDIEMSLVPAAGQDADNEPLISRDRTDSAAADGAVAFALTSGNLFVYALTISAGVGSLLFGYDTGVISSTLVCIDTDLSGRLLTTLDKSLITSCTSLFALIASPIAGMLADKLGRKKIILFADALFTLGALWQAVTSSVWGMILGRSIVGLAIGGASLIVPLYISELAPSHLRGRLVTISLLFTTGGQVVAYVIGWLFSDMMGGWRWMVGIGAFPAITQLTMLVFMPETPRYLMKTNREEAAKAVLKKVYRSKQSSSDTTDAQVSRILHAIRTEILTEESANLNLKATATASSPSSAPGFSLIPPTLASLIFHTPYRRALTIACLLQALQQACGFNSLMYFSATIFQLLAFSSPTLTSLSIATTNFIFTITAFYLIDRIGRRRILLYTVPMMAVALLFCAAAFAFVQLPTDAAGNLSSGGVVVASADPGTPSPSSSRTPAIVILICLLLYVSPYATGLGPVPWMQSELFPLAVRSVGSALATATNWGCNTLVGLTFLPMMELLGPQTTFVTYAAICVAGFAAIWAIYPETGGCELEEVGRLLDKGFRVGVTESIARWEERRKEGSCRHTGGDEVGDQGGGGHIFQQLDHR